MKKALLKINVISLLFLVVVSTGLFAQVGSTKNNPATSAALDLTNTTNKGLLIPRVSLASTADVITVPAPVASMLVYNTNTGITGTGALGAGFYYYDGTVWKKLITIYDTNDNLGNHIATQDLNMQGRKINFALADGIKVLLTNSTNGPYLGHNSGWVHALQAGYKSIGVGQVTWSNYGGTGNNTIVERMRLTPSGYLGIGTATPAVQLQVAGSALVDQQLTVKNLASGPADKINVVDTSGLYKRAIIDLTGLPVHYDYTLPSVPNGSPGSATVVSLPVYMLTVATGNACGRTGIAAFAIAGNTISYLGGQARDIIYTVTHLGTTGSSLQLFATIPGCAGGEGTHAFNFTVSVSGNIITIVSNADNSNAGVFQTYSLSVFNF